MSFSQLQRAIASLVCDRRALDAYRDDPPAWLSTRGLPPREAAVLDGLDGESLAAFQEIHARDRAYFLEAVMPLTTARLGAGWRDGYFEAEPYGDDDTRVEAARFTRFLEERMDDPAASLLARFELARLRLFDAPVFHRSVAPAPIDAAKAHLAPGLAIVESRLHLPTLVEDPLDETPPPCEGIALLRRDPDGITTAWVDGPSGRLLAAVGRRERETLRSLLGSPSGRVAFAEAAAQGVVL